MAHYAFLDENNIVTEVINGRNENEIVDGISNWEEHYGNVRNQLCLRTSYHGNIRKNFACVDGTYRFDLDAFICIKPYESWVLNEENCLWVAPILQPEQGINGIFYMWSEYNNNWIVDPVISKQEQP